MDFEVIQLTAKCGSILYYLSLSFLISNVEENNTLLVLSL